MKFLLGYNMKIVVLFGNKYLVRAIFPGGGRLSKAWADGGILVSVIKASERSNILEVYFHSSQPNWEIYGNDFYVP